MRRYSMLRLAVVLAALVLLGGGWQNVFAQVTSASVTGTIRDTQSGVIPGATVVLTSVSRGTTTRDGVESPKGTSSSRRSSPTPTRSR